MLPERLGYVSILTLKAVCLRVAEPRQVNAGATLPLHPCGQRMGDPLEVPLPVRVTAKSAVVEALGAVVDLLAPGVRCPTKDPPPPLVHVPPQLAVAVEQAVALGRSGCGLQPRPAVGLLRPPQIVLWTVAPVVVLVSDYVVVGHGPSRMPSGGMYGRSESPHPSLMSTTRAGSKYGDLCCWPR